MQHWPRISVVTPSFNQAAFLERTIRSVLDQDYPSLEYLVVDGGSSDKSAVIIKKYAGRLTWWCSERDEGQAHAISKGFDRSTGEVLCWLNSDDILLPGALRAVGTFFRDHPAAEVVNGSAFYINASDRPVGSGLQSSYTHGVRASAQRFRFYGQDGVYQQATFWRRDPYFAVGGVRKEFIFAMDLDLFTRLATRQRFHVIPRYLACFRIHAANKSSTIEDVRRKEVLSIRSQYGVLEAHPVRRFGLYWWYRVASLTRKALLQLKLALGTEKFPAIPEVPGAGETGEHP